MPHSVSGIAQCYNSPYQKTQNNMSKDPETCHNQCESLYPTESWNYVRYPNRMLSDSCNVRCSQLSEGSEPFPDKDVQAIEPFGNIGGMQIDILAILKFIFRYLVEAAVVATVAFYLPMSESKPSMMELAQLTGGIAVTFFLLDLVAPEVGMGARFGAGAGIGASRVGFTLR